MKRDMPCADLLELCKHSQDIYLVGCGEYGQLIKGFLKINQIEIKGFIISIPYSRKYETCMDISISTLEEFCRQKEKDALVILSFLKEDDYESIKEKLGKAGFKKVYADGAGLKAVKQKILNDENMKRTIYSEIHRWEKIWGDAMMEIVKERPVDLNIDTINFCPLRCRFCANSKIKRERKVMEMDLFEKICKEYAKMGGGGIGIASRQTELFSDPLIHERFQFLNHMEGRDKLCVYTTNPLLSLARYPDEDVAFFLRSLDFLQVSVDGFDKEEYRLLTGIDGFEIFVEQLYRIKRIIEKEHLKTRLELAGRSSDREKALQSAFFKQINSDFYVEHIIDSYFTWNGAIREEDLWEDAKILKKWDPELQKEDCLLPMAVICVDSFGQVIGCGCEDWNSEYVIGDCRKNSLTEIWHSDEAKKFRHAFSENRIPRICQGCEIYHTAKEVFSRWQLENYKLSDGVIWARGIWNA